MSTAGNAPLLEVRNLVKHYPIARSVFGASQHIQALKGINFTLEKGKSLGIVGESGSGKSTLARLVMALEAPTSGEVILNGQNLHQLPARELRLARVNFQMVFQDPFGSLDPRQTVLKIITEPLQFDSTTKEKIAQAAKRDAAAQALREVGLNEADLDKYPHEFSGGQRQRIAIARALITKPTLIVADEPVSALDVSVQAQVLNLMQDLQERYGLAYLLISHDLAVIDLVCDDVLVLKDGVCVEQGPADTLFSNAKHPYTKALIAAVPGAFTA